MYIVMQKHNNIDFGDLQTIELEQEMRNTEVIIKQERYVPRFTYRGILVICLILVLILILALNVHKK
jgi:hypothetical protein